MTTSTCTYERPFGGVEVQVYIIIRHVLVVAAAGLKNKESKAEVWTKYAIVSRPQGEGRR